MNELMKSLMILMKSLILNNKKEKFHLILFSQIIAIREKEQRERNLFYFILF